MAYAFDEVSAVLMIKRTRYQANAICIAVGYRVISP